MTVALDRGHSPADIRDWTEGDIMQLALYDIHGRV